MPRDPKSKIKKSKIKDTPNWRLIKEQSFSREADRPNLPEQTFHLPL